MTILTPNMKREPVMSMYIEELLLYKIGLKCNTHFRMHQIDVHGIIEFLQFNVVPPIFD